MAGAHVSGRHILTQRRAHQLAHRRRPADQQRREDQAATGQLHAGHGLAEPRRRQQCRPHRLHHHDHHAVAVRGQALGIGLDQEARRRADHRAGHHPARQHRPEAVDGRLPGLAAERQQRRQQAHHGEHDGGERQRRHLVAEAAGRARSLVGGARVEDVEQREDACRQHVEQLARRRPQTVLQEQQRQAGAGHRQRQPGGQRRSLAEQQGGEQRHQHHAEVGQERAFAKMPAGMQAHDPAAHAEAEHHADPRRATDLAHVQGADLTPSEQCQQQPGEQEAQRHEQQRRHEQHRFLGEYPAHRRQQQSGLNNPRSYCIHPVLPHESSSHRRHAGQSGQPRALRQPDRHHHRVLRLLHLRHGGGAGVPAPVLPGLGPDLGHAAVAGHLRHRLFRAPAGLGGVRPFRRPHRPQGHAGSGAADHGPVDGDHRPAADLRPDRRAGTAAAGHLPLRPGLRPGRGVGRRRAAGDRERATRQARLVRHVPAAGSATGLPALHRLLPGADALAQRSRLHGLGLAHSVHRQQPAGAGRPLCAPAHHRNAILPENPGTQRTCRSAHADPVPRTQPGSGAGHPDRPHRVRGVLPDDRVLAELGHLGTGLQSRGVPQAADDRRAVLRRHHPAFRRARRPLRPLPHAGRQQPADDRLRLQLRIAVQCRRRLEHAAVPEHRPGPDGTGLRTAGHHPVGTVPDRGALHGVIAGIQPRRHLRRLAGALRRHLAGHPPRHRLGRLLPGRSGRAGAERFAADRGDPPAPGLSSSCLRPGPTASGKTPSLQFPEAVGPGREYPPASDPGTAGPSVWREDAGRKL
ncbi:UNVERIFIED_CONTAM: hypothetical protein NCL1_03708 [Trichonephila clavipes]